MKSSNPASVNDFELMKKIEKMYLNNRSTMEMAEVLGFTKNQIVGLINNGRRHGYDFPIRPANFWRLKRRQTKGVSVDPIAMLKRKEVQAKSSAVKAAQFKPVRERRDPIDPALKQLYETGQVALRYYRDPEEPDRIGVSLLDLHAKGCKYPVDEVKGSHRFCAKPAEDNTSYCAEHLKVMWPNKYR